jgi:hypothetical protein
VPGFEDEDDDEDENEAPCEGWVLLNQFLGLKLQAESSSPFGTMSDNSRSPFPALTALTAMPALPNPWQSVDRAAVFLLAIDG